MIIPSCAEPGQPHEDKFILQRTTEEIKEELQSEFPDKNDNIMILLQADGYKPNGNEYRSGIKAHIGYKDPERARTEMLEMQKDLSSDERFYDSTIEQLKSKDPKMMKKLNDATSVNSDLLPKDGIKKYIKLNFVDNIKDIVEELPYYITELSKEPTAEELKKQEEIRKEKELSGFRYWLKHWLDDASPPIY